MIDLSISTGLIAGLFGLLATFSLTPALFFTLILLRRIPGPVHRRPEGMTLSCAESS